MIAPSTKYHYPTEMRKAGFSTEEKPVFLKQKRRKVTIEYYEWIEYCYKQVVKNLKEDRLPYSREVLEYAREHGDTLAESAGHMGYVLSALKLPKINAFTYQGKSSANFELYNEILEYIYMGYTFGEDLHEVVPGLAGKTKESVLSTLVMMKKKGYLPTTFKVKYKDD